MHALRRRFGQRRLLPHRDRHVASQATIGQCTKSLPSGQCTADRLLGPPGRRDGAQMGDPPRPVRPLAGLGFAEDVRRDQSNVIESISCDAIAGQIELPSSPKTVRTTCSLPTSTATSRRGPSSGTALNGSVSSTHA